MLMNHHTDQKVQTDKFMNKLDIQVLSHYFNISVTVLTKR